MKMKTLCVPRLEKLYPLGKIVVVVANGKIKYTMTQNLNFHLKHMKPWQQESWESHMIPIYIKD